MENVYVPYVERIKAKNRLPDDQHSILYLDCYPVHTGTDFRDYLKQSHPTVFVIYVPANCELKFSTPLH